MLRKSLLLSGLGFLLAGVADGFSTGVTGPVSECSRQLYTQIPDLTSAAFKKNCFSEGKSVAGGKTPPISAPPPEAACCALAKPLVFKTK